MITTRTLEVEAAYRLRGLHVNERGATNLKKIWPELFESLSEAQNHRCCYCGVRTDPDGPRESNPTLERIVPTARGGRDVPENLAMACRSCNERRGSRRALDFLRETQRQMAVSAGRFRQSGV